MKTSTTQKTKLQHLEEIRDHWTGWRVGREMALKELDQIRGAKPEETKERLRNLYNAEIQDWNEKADLIQEIIDKTVEDSEL